MATQAELQWLAANPQMAAQFGQNPPNGTVAQFARQWYDQPEQRGVQPDAIDSAMFRENGIAAPGVDTAPATNYGTQNLGFAGLTPNAAGTPAPATNPSLYAGPQTAYSQSAPNTNPTISFPNQVAAPAPAVPSQPALPTGGNFNQAQNGSQTGAFNTVGTQATAQQQQTGQTQTGTQSGFSNLVGTNAQQQQQAQQTVGGSTQATQQAGTTAQQQQQAGTTAEQQQTAAQMQQQQVSNQVGNQISNQAGTQSTTESGNQATQQSTQQTGNQTTTDIGRQIASQVGNQVGSTVAHETGNIGTTNTTQNQVDDTLGFGALLKSLQGNAAQTDAQRNAYLTDFVNTGGSGFNSQVDQAVRNSLTGAQMTGAGDSARARASGYAAAQIARQNADQRLAAAQQLAGPTAVQQLSTAANPYLGSRSSSVGNQAIDTTTGTTSNLATQNTTDTSQNNTSNQAFSNLANTVGNTQSNNTANQAFNNTGNVASNVATNTATGQQSVGTTNTAGQNASTSNTQGQQQGVSNTQATNFQNLLSQLQSVGSNTQNQTTGGTSATNTAGFSNLFGTQAETQSGNASGMSSQSAAGQIPQAQQVSTGGGGCVLCTAGIELGIWRNKRVLRNVIAYKMRTPAFHPAARGYFFLFTPLARWLLSHPKVARTLAPLARAVVYEELRVAGRRIPRRSWASIVHWTGHALCHLIGKLPVPGRVTDPVIEGIARRNNVWFSLS